MFDVTRPETLHALERWWSEFRERAPVSDEELESYCCVLVGNKTDLVCEGNESTVTFSEAQNFIDDLVPPTSPASSLILPISDAGEAPTRPVSTYEDATDETPEIHDVSYLVPPPTKSIEISRQHHRRRSKSLSRNSQIFLTNGTMTTTHSGLTSFHTPSSSLYDHFESARATPLSFRSASPSPHSRRSSRSTRRRALSLSSISSTSAATITPSLYTKNNTNVRERHAPVDEPIREDPGTETPRAVLETRPKLFLTSAKTGVGVSDIFEYVARRVVSRWEWEEAVEARTLYLEEGYGSVIRLDDLTHGSDRGRKAFGTCCF
jgi:Ras-related protein Rab-7A